MEAPIAATVNDSPSYRISRHIGAALAALLLWAGLCGSAQAEWQVIYAQPEEFVELDLESRRPMPPLVTIWTRITYTKALGDAAETYQSQGQLHAIDCAMRASTVIGIVNYSGAMGQGVAGERRPRPRAEWKPKPVPPGSLAAMIVDQACRGER
ncbi:MAG TPA: surface-adhesin E family protein [Burkholderiales bacterium]|nr:surface-adhesin E family protein [Burkholderiales bacterium]